MIGRGSAAEAVAASVHQLAGSLHMGADECPVTFDDVAADDHRFDIGRAGSEHHDGYGVADPVEVR
jgi:hypothetical protein